MSKKHVNRYSTTLSGAHNNSTTSITVTSVTGFPTLTGTDYAALTVDDGAGNWEIIKITENPTGTTFANCVRGHEGSTAQSWDDATKIEMRFTAESVDNKIDSANVSTFKTIAVSGQSDIVADSSTDTLTVVAGTGITLTTDAGTDTLTIESSGGGGGSGDVVGPSSSVANEVVLFDGTTGKLVKRPSTGGMVIPAGSTGGGPATDWALRGNTDTLRLEFRIEGSYSGTQVLIDADFSGTGFMKRTGSGTFTTVSDPYGLTDPNADRIMFWDDSAGITTYLACGTNLSISGTTLNATFALADGDYGDVTVSGSGTVFTIDNGTVSLAKMANMATASVIYRKTGGSGAPEVQTLATLKTDLGLTGTNSGDQTVPSAATQSDQETTTSTTTYVSPGRQQYHPSAAKAWINCTDTGTINLSYNVTSITDTGTGKVTITFTTAFSNTNYVFSGFPPVASLRIMVPATKNTGSLLVEAYTTGLVLADAGGFDVQLFGDQ